jgi:hypothetical protein
VARLRPIVVCAFAAALCLAAAGAGFAATTPGKKAVLKHRTRTALAAPTLADVDTRMTYSGRVDGASSGRVELESRTLVRPAWKRFAIVRVAADGSFTFTTDVPGSGTYRIKAVFLGDGSHLPSSAVVSFQVI